MDVKPDSLSLRPSKLPPHGGRVKVKFTASEANPVKKIRATVALTPASYVLVDGSPTREFVFACKAASNVDAVYEIDLEISHGEFEDVKKVIVTVAFKQLHSNGKPSKEKGLSLSGDIKIRALTDKERQRLGATLLNLRGKKDHTQKELKEEAGVSVTTIRKAEQGKKVSDKSLLTILSTLKGN